MSDSRIPGEKISIGGLNTDEPGKVARKNRTTVTRKLQIGHRPRGGIPEKGRMCKIAGVGDVSPAYSSGTATGRIVLGKKKKTGPNQKHVGGFETGYSAIRSRGEGRLHGSRSERSGETPKARVFATKKNRDSEKLRQKKKRELLGLAAPSPTMSSYNRGGRWAQSTLANRGGSNRPVDPPRQRLWFHGGGKRVRGN